MNLIGACWMRRSLDEPVSALFIDDNHDVVAGGWDGRLAKWNASGDLLWSVELPDRVGSIAANENGIYATAGLHLSALNSENGALMWQHPLEGSADIVTTVDELVYATSSVYDIEHNDFIDSAIWCFDLSGSQLWVKHMPERPWTLDELDGNLYLGLGRPKMGVAQVSSGGDVEHKALDSNSSVTASVNFNGNLIFGHANGDLTSLEERLVNGQGKSVNSILHDGNQLIRIDDKNITQLGTDYQQSLQVSVGNITAISNGIIVNDSPTIWCGIQDINKGLLKVISLTDGNELASMQAAKISVITSNIDRVVIGDEQGEVYVWEQAMLNRRFNSASVDDDDDRRQQMRERLNALRKREL